MRHILSIFALSLIGCALAFSQGIGGQAGIGGKAGLGGGAPSGGGGSTVAFLNTGSATHQTGASFSASFTVNTGGANVCAFAPVAYDTAGGLTITAITYGGNAMTAVGAAVNDGTVYVELFYLCNPPTGSNTLAISGSTGTGEIYANLVSFTGVNQTTPVRPATYTTATGTSGYSITIPSNAHDLTMAVISTTDIVTSTNQTSDGINTAGSNDMGSDHATTAASSITDTWSASGTFCLAGFSIQHA